jgi:beta-galactosidase
VGADERSGDYLLTGGSARASSDGDWSETYICDLFDWTLKEQETMPWLTGALQWAFKDFPTPLRPENPMPRMNQKGLLERDGNPKEGYYVFQSYWAKTPMVHIYAHTWPIRWGAPGESKWVKVYSNCDTAELFHNGQSCGAKKRNSQDFPAAGLRWNIPFREGENRLRVVARRGNAEVSDEIAFQYQTRKWGKPARLDFREIARNSGLVTVEARVFDQAGVQCLDSRIPVHFRIAGDGTLVDNLGTTLTCRALQMYNGRALLSLKNGSAESSVSVESEGLPTALLRISI